MQRLLSSLGSSIVLVFLLCGVAWGLSADLPCVSGETQALALSNLSGAGFVSVSSQTYFSDTVAVGSVVSEIPQCGEIYDVGTAVQLTISQGPLSLAGAAVFGTVFNQILLVFALGLFFGLFIKMTNRS